VTSFYPCPADFPPEHLKMFALKRSSKPGAGSTLLTGGCCQPAAATVAPDQSSMRRCGRLPCLLVGGRFLTLKERACCSS